MPLPTARFLPWRRTGPRSGGSGLRAARRSASCAIGLGRRSAVDLFGTNHYGIPDNSGEPPAKNVAAAGGARPGAGGSAFRRQLPFTDERRFDAARASRQIDHLRKRRRHGPVAEVRRVLKPGGEFWSCHPIATAGWMLRPLLRCTVLRWLAAADYFGGSASPLGYTVIERSQVPGALYCWPARRLCHTSALSHGSQAHHPRRQSALRRPRLLHRARLRRIRQRDRRRAGVSEGLLFQRYEAKTAVAPLSALTPVGAEVSLALPPSTGYGWRWARRTMLDYFPARVLLPLLSPPSFGSEDFVAAS